MSEPVSTSGAWPAGRFALRLVWVVVQLLLVHWLGASGALFFYQGF